MASYNFRMEINMKENLRRIKLKDLELLSGQVKKSILDFGYFIVFFLN